MKTLKCFLLVAAVALSIIGCRKPVEVSFATDTQELDVQGGSVEVALKSNGEWTLSSTAEWITISPMSGNGDAMLTLTAEANTAEESRSAEIKASTKDNTATLTLTQGAAPQPQHYITVTPQEYQCGSAGGEFTVEVLSNIDWIITAPQWISHEVTEGSDNATVTLTVSAIDGDFGGMREADVVFGSLLASASIRVVQTEDPVLGIEIAPHSLDFVCTGETKTVAVTTEDAWTASSMAEWVTLSQNEGQGDAEVSVTLGENPLYTERQTSVMFTTAGGIQAMLNIRQEASPDPHFLEASPLEFQFAKEGGESEITIGCDTDWQFDMDCEWLSLSQLSGTGNAVVVLTATANIINEPRTMSFHIKSGALNYQFDVRQEAGEEPLVASFDMDTLYVDYTGGVRSLQLTSNTTWMIQTSSWISMYAGTSGQGDALLNIVVDSNADPDDRLGYVNAVHNGQVLASLPVVQEGKPNILETDYTEIEVRPEGGDYVIQVTANQSWTVAVDVAWLHCNPQGGFGNGTFTITVDALSSPRPRTGHVKVSGSTGIEVMITIIQQ